MGFDLTKISNTRKKEQKSEALTNILQKEIISFSKTFSNKNKEDFYTEISVLLNAGITLKEALQLVIENERKKSAKQLLQDITQLIVNGKSFSDAIMTKKEFTQYEYNSLRIGEETGTLNAVSKELGLFYFRKNEQRRMLITALTYPVIIMVTACLVVVFMLRYVVPMFMDIFKQNNVELPWLTQMILNASNFLNSYGWILLLFIFLLWIASRVFRKNEIYRKAKDGLLLKIPYVGHFLKNVYLAQFTQAVSLLTSSKVPILRSIQLVKVMIDFYPLQSALDKVEYSILRGTSLSESMKATNLFDNKMVSLVRVAEQTNQMDYIFQRLNEQYNIEIQQKSKLLSAIIEPLIIVFVGIIVGIILIAMYLPMFKLSSVLG